MTRKNIRFRINHVFQKPQTGKHSTGSLHIGTYTTTLSKQCVTGKQAIPYQITSTSMRMTRCKDRLYQHLPNFPWDHVYANQSLSFKLGICYLLMRHPYWTSVFFS